MTEEELMNLCKKANLTLIQTQVVFSRLIKQRVERVLTFEEIAFEHHFTFQRAAQAFEAGMAKIEKVRKDS